MDTAGSSGAALASRFIARTLGDSRLLHLTNVRPLTCTNYNNNIIFVLAVTVYCVSVAPIKVITFWRSEDI